MITNGKEIFSKSNKSPDVAAQSWIPCARRRRAVPVEHLGMVLSRRSASPASLWVSHGPGRSRLPGGRLFSTCRTTGDAGLCAHHLQWVVTERVCLCSRVALQPQKLRAPHRPRLSRYTASNRSSCCFRARDGTWDPLGHRLFDKPARRQGGWGWGGGWGGLYRQP